MNNTTNPVIIEAEELLQSIKQQHPLLIVDLSTERTWKQIHLEGAVHIHYGDIVRAHPPVNGLLADQQQFAKILATIGWQPHLNMVCYDDEGGGMAGRFLWTCHAYGIDRVSMLNGGINYWYAKAYPYTAEIIKPTPAEVSITYQGNNLCDAEYIMQNLKKLHIMDARSAEEYNGIKKYAARGGHIPGAVNFDWIHIMDRNNHLKCHSFLELDQQIASLWPKKLNKTDEIVVYCQTHHRSALNYTLLKHLGYQNVRGYHGSWSDWGNRSDTPIEE